MDKYSSNHQKSDNRSADWEREWVLCRGQYVQDSKTPTSMNDV